MGSQGEIRIFVETGKKRVFAGVLDWPGWCRRGKDETSALQALLVAGPRYAKAMAIAELDFTAPGDTGIFKVIERVPGNSTTDFGAPDAALESDQDPIDTHDLVRFRAILKGCWGAFDQAAAAAQGNELRTGPRGGGRDLTKITDHLVGGDASYLGRIGWKAPKTGGLAAMRAALLKGLEASARGELPIQGPRGGLRWPARRFMRRVAWHALDHAWEIEDRII